MNKPVTDKYLHAIDQAISDLQPYGRHQEALMNAQPIISHQDVGRLSAEAVAAEYTAAAKAIEAMGHDLTEMQRKLEAETQVLHEAQDEIKAVAALYRQKATEAFSRIETASLTIQEIRTLCSEAREKIQQA